MRRSRFSEEQIIQVLHREAGLAVRRKGKRKRSQAPHLVREGLVLVNQRWCLDFLSDTLSSGRTWTLPLGAR